MCVFRFVKRIGRNYGAFFLGYFFALFVCVGIFISSDDIRQFESSRLKKEFLEERNKTDLKRILFFNSFFGDPLYEFGHGQTPFENHQCKVTNCFVTDNHHLFLWTEYDAVVFHWPKLRGEPESWNQRKVLEERSDHQRYIFFSLESPPNYRNDYSHFRRFFNWTMSYRDDSDVSVRHGEIQQVKDKNSKIDFSQKTKLVSWFVSRCRSFSKREKYVKKLQKFINVDIYGYCGPNKCGSFGLRLQYRKCDDILRDYKFYLSLENSVCTDYVTEKFYTALEHDTVPIVIGDSNFYRRNAPKGSYIDAQDYTPEKLADYLLYLDTNHTAYQEYFAWRKTHYAFMYPSLLPVILCNLCERLNIDNKTKIIPDLEAYWSRGQCKNPSYLSTFGLLDFM